jgi:hypothetical protein
MPVSRRITYAEMKPPVEYPRWARSDASVGVPAFSANPMFLCALMCG